MELPSSLRTWFVVHSFIDVSVAIPLLVAPAVLLEPLGWTAVDPVATRLVGAALLAIGLQSFFGRNEGFETYRAMLRLKVIWSMTAVGGLLAGIAGGAPTATWAFLAIFLAFLGVWSHYAIRLKQLAGAPADDEDVGDDNAASEDSASI
ncbi:MAG: hypothetical protein QOI66_821 [Myxococcales bacterium]|nr:hypothetical protein [Myxococcales bacterium]